MYCSVVSVMPIVTKRLRLELRGFHCNLLTANFSQNSTIPQLSAYYDGRHKLKGFFLNFKHNFGLTYRLAYVTRVHCDKTTANGITRF